MAPGSAKQSSPPGLKVIGAGLGRTGTSSLKKALELLYGAKCYHSARPWKLCATSLRFRLALCCV